MQLLNFLKVFLTTFFLFSASITLHAQSSWVNKFENEKIAVNYKKEACNDVSNGIYKENVLLQLVNKTNEKLEVTFKKELWHNGVCSNCNSNSKEHIVTVVLNPNENTSASCSENKQLSIFSRMLNLKKSELTKFEIKDFVINKAQ
jgi:hypothetical protein